MRKAIFLFFCFLSTLVIAQKNTLKGLTALQDANYGLARSYFQKENSKSPIAARYGWSQYYMSSYGFDADSAYLYLTLFEQAYASLDLDINTKAKLQTKLSLQDSIIDSLFRHLATQELQVLKVDPKISRLEVFMQRYGQKYPDYLQTSTSLRDSLAFDLALTAHSAAAYQEFILRYPFAKQYEEAKRRFELLLYKEQTQQNRESDYFAYITKYPDGPYVEEAWKRLYDKYIQMGTIESFSSFIENYPKAPQIGLAWRQIYRLYMRTYSVEKLKSFEADYPNYPFIEDLEKDGELLLKQLYPFIEGQKYGYIDAAGKEIIPAQYDDVSAFVEGLAIVSKETKYGLINKRNEAILPFKYLDVSIGKGGFIVEDSVGYMLLDSQGQFIQKDPIEWEELQQVLTAYNWQVVEVTDSQQNRFEIEERNGKMGVTRKSKTILSFKYDEVAYTEENPMFIAKQGRNLLYFDTTGKRIDFTGLDWFLNANELASFTKDGYAVCSKAGKLGLMDQKGRILIKHAFESAQPFWGGAWAVQQNGKWGLIGLDSKVILPFKNQKIIPFPPFGYLVDDAGGLGLISTSGKWILKPEYKTIKLIDDTYFLLEDAGGLGLCSSNGLVLVPCQYQRIVRYDENSFQLTTSEGLVYFLIDDQKFLTKKP